MPATIARSYKYRCYPNTEQEQTLFAWQVACRDVQRLCIKDRRSVEYLRRWGGRKNATITTDPVCNPSVSMTSNQSRQVTAARKIDPLWDAVPADTMSAVVKRVDQAWQKMWSERKQGNWKAKARWAKHPAHVGLLFRGSKRGTQFVGADARYGYWKIAGALKLGMLKVRMHRPIPDGATINQVHLTHAADGWYISFSCDIPRPDPLPPANKAVNGVDLNVIHRGDDQQVAAVDDGRVYKVTNTLKRNARKLAHMQRMVDPKRKVKGNAKSADPNSTRTKRRRAKIAQLHQRVARQREHTLQYIAKRLVETADTTRFEDLNLRAMRSAGKKKKTADPTVPPPTRRGKKKVGRRRKRGLNRAFSTAAPGRLIQLTKEKAAIAGRTVEKVPAAYTSRVCSTCGDLGDKKPLNVRQWTCTQCGTTHDRDINAAKNIAAGGVKEQVAGVLTDTLNARGGRLRFGAERRSVNRESAQAVAAEQQQSTQIIESTSGQSFSIGMDQRDIPDFRKLTPILRKKRVANKQALCPSDTIHQLELFEEGCNSRLGS